MISEQIKRLRELAVKNSGNPNAMFLKHCADTIEVLSAKLEAAKMERSTAYYNGGWIPVEECLPEDDQYVLMSFENFSLPMIGRYEKQEDGSGNWYLGDCDEEDTCLANDLFVNAWMRLPEQYK